MLFTREPDYFDSEITSAKIIEISGVNFAEYTDGRKTYRVIVEYAFPFDKDHVSVIYDPSDPAKGNVYSFIGYWIRIEEVIVSLLVLFTLYFVARSITGNPTPEALLEELEGSRKKPRKPKYDL